MGGHQKGGLELLLIGLLWFFLLYALCCYAKWRIARHYGKPFWLRLSDWEYMKFNPHWMAWRVLLLFLVAMGLVAMAWGLMD